MSTKLSIAKYMTNQSGLSLNQSKILLDKFLLIIKKESRTKNVKLSGFGTFYSHITPKRHGRNPKTLESYIIKSNKKLILRTSSRTKKLLN